MTQTTPMMTATPAVERSPEAKALKVWVVLLTLVIALLGTVLILRERIVEAVAAVCVALTPR